MTAVGLDLGGTKIEVQVFDDAWQLVRRNRVSTPKDYDALVTAMAEQIKWADEPSAPVGVAAAGLVNPRTGLALTANLSATGKPFPADIERAAGRPVTYVNDCRAMTLSEAIFGAGRDRNPVVGLILGTGVGGGVAVDGKLVDGRAMVGGEFGHMPAPAHLVARYDLPVVQCGCGRMGCVETYVAGPGLTRIAAHLTGTPVAPRDLAASRRSDPEAARVWDIWTAFVAELLITLTMTIDPDCVVLGGGLSLMDGVVEALAEAVNAVQLPGFDVPEIILAQGGETSGARGAAYAAWQTAQEAAEHV